MYKIKHFKNAEDFKLWQLKAGKKFIYERIFVNNKYLSIEYKRKRVICIG